MTISIAVITYNNEAYIEDLIQSSKWADEVIIVDSGSTDKTINIAESILPNAKIIYRKFDNFSNQRNFAAEQSTCDWILHCDSDEVIPPELSDEIAIRLQNTQIETSAFNVTREYYWLGKRLSHCDGPNGMGAVLHRRDKATYVGKIHEKLVVDGSIELLSNKMKHICHDSVYSRITKLAKYAFEESISRPPPKESTLHNILFLPTRTFLGHFIFRRGYRDGLNGLIYCILQSIGKMLIGMYHWERTHTPDR